MKIKEYVVRFSQAHWLFVIVALVFGGFFIFLTPPLWGPDENIHFVHSYQVSKGNFSQNVVVVDGHDSYGIGVPQSIVSLNSLKDNDINDWKPGETKQVESTTDYVRIGSTPLKDEKTVVNPFGKIIYPPFVYTAPAIGEFISNFFNPTILSLLYSARIATLIFYIMIVFISIFILRKTSFRWVIFVIALLPSSLYQSSVVSADPLIISLSLLLFSSIYYISHIEKRIPKRYIALTAFVAALIVAIKPPYIFLIFIIPFLHINKYVSYKTKMFIKAGIPIICILIAAAIIAFNVGAGDGSTIPTQGISPSTQLYWIVSHPLDYLYVILKSVLTIDWTPQVIGVFGSSFIFIPAPIIYILLSSIALTTFIKTQGETNLEKNGVKLRALAYIGMSVISCIAIVTTLYLAFNAIGSGLVGGVQGRYFLPIIVFTLFGIRSLTQSRLAISERNARILYSSLMLFCLTISILWYYKVLY